MLTLQQIKADPARVVERLAIKGFDGKEPIDRVLALDNRRRELQLDNDNKAAELNRIAASVGRLMKEGNKAEAEEARARVGALKEAQKEIASQLAETETQLRELLCTIPNQPYCHLLIFLHHQYDNPLEYNIHLPEYTHVFLLLHLFGQK